MLRQFKKEGISSWPLSFDSQGYPVVTTTNRIINHFPADPAEQRRTQRPPYKDPIVKRKTTYAKRTNAYRSIILLVRMIPLF